ncbi:hypothetical protein FJP69_01875 [Stenotrophomonas maltophilia]|nr:hypothetical protein FJP69_01875 [Stenotrophomonas maltophilia]
MPSQRGDSWGARRPTRHRQGTPAHTTFHPLPFRHSTCWMWTADQVSPGDWIVRSRQSLSRYGNGPSRFDQIEAYAQRTLIGSKQVLQLGELSVSNPLLSGAPITGMQLLPEEALQQGSSSVEVQRMLKPRGRPFHRIRTNVSTGHDAGVAIRAGYAPKVCRSG